MKYLSLFGAMAISVVATAQRNVDHVRVLGHAPGMNDGLRTPTDTLVPPSLDVAGATLTVYSTQQGGYVVGANGYGDAAKVQVFSNTESTMVEQLLFIFGAKEGNGSSVVHARVYALDGTGTASTGPATNAPGTVLGNTDLTVDQCDTTDLTVVTFSPAVAVSGDFGVGIDVADLAAGTYVGLASTADAAAGAVPDNNWELWSDGAWYTLTAAWPLTFDIAVYAVIGDGAAGIEDAGAVNNMRMSIIGANPANQQVTVAYELLQSADARLTVMDGKGAKVVDQQMGRTGAGEYRTDLDVRNYADGTYYITIFSDGMPLTKKLVVKH